MCDLKIENFSVLISIYKNDKVSYFEEAFNSIIDNTLVPNEIVIVFDGSISKDISKFIELKQSSLGSKIKIKVIKLETNRGLGLALREGLKYCTNSLVSRADADDINRIDRFEKQIALFKEQPDIVLTGGQVQEFLEYPGDQDNVRSVPILKDDIDKFASVRSPFNHPTVMFKKEAIENVGSYQDFKGFEDYHLWVRIIMSGSSYQNSPDVLVDMRAGFYNRRGGLEYMKKYINLRKYFVDLKFTSRINGVCCIFLMLLSNLLSVNVRKFVYNTFLRKKCTEIQGTNS